MSLQLHEVPNPILTQRCEPVKKFTTEIKMLAMDMLNLMYHHDGIGLAAPQAGRLLRIFVVDVWWPTTGTCDQARVFINPKVTLLGNEEVRSSEGCLSLPGQSVIVTRSKRVHVEAIGLDGRAVSLDADGILSICIQHENDHLDGVLMTDRGLPPSILA